MVQVEGEGSRFAIGCGCDRCVGVGIVKADIRLFIPQPELLRGLQDYIDDQSAACGNEIGVDHR